jgi:hypothetical protein
MSHVLILSSDIEMTEYHSDNVLITNSYFGKECIEIDRFVKKAYFYVIDISATKQALLELKKYLTTNTEPGNEVELWSIWLGGDFTKHYRSMPKISNIPSSELKDIEDLIDDYAEEHFNPKIRRTHICELSINDISFIDNHTGVCLVVCH